MYPFLFPEWFGYNVPLYDLMIAIGIFFMLTYVAKRLDKQAGMTKKEANQLLVFLILGLGSALLFSYLFDGVFHTISAFNEEANTTSFLSLLWMGLIGDLASNVPSTFGTITFIGGLAGGVAAFVLLLKYGMKYDRKKILSVMNIVIIGVVLAHAFGRIGCFFAGCCHGIPTDSFLGIMFPDGAYSSQLYGIHTEVYPTQLYESAFLFLLFGLLNKLPKVKTNEFGVYLLSYGIWRFLLEFIRGDARGSLFGFIVTQYNTYPTPSQFLSLIMMGLGMYFLIRSGFFSNHQKAVA
jgi:phosphatidylglycerol:prolipoprotein diacylglycerol transferase